MLLAIDTSTGSAVAAVADDGRVLAERAEPDTRRHAEAIGVLITGTLAAKSLTMSQAATLGVAASPVQAIDILVVQANTNTLAAHFASLCSCLRLRRRAEVCAAAGAKA